MIRKGMHRSSCVVATFISTYINMLDTGDIVMMNSSLIYTMKRLNSSTNLHLLIY